MHSRHLWRIYAGMLAFVAPFGLYAQGTGEVTDARLLSAHEDAANWIMFGHGYNNHHYSALSQIDRKNVASLVPRWVYQTGLTASFQAEPLTVDGTLFLTMPFNHMVAIDALTGQPRWRYQHSFRAGVSGGSPGGPANRGAAAGYGAVYQATNDGRLLALDQKTGKVIWDVVFAQPSAAEMRALEGRPDLQAALKKNMQRINSKMPPLVYDGMVIVGTLSGEEDLAILPGEGGRLGGADGERIEAGDLAAIVEARYGQRAFLAAFSAKTGAELWRWYVTGPGWEGNYVETTGDGMPLGRNTAAERAAAPLYPNSWWAGGGTTWSTPALDPELGLLYAGTGNPGLGSAPGLRPGDNLYTSSVVALDVRTGKLVWHYQIVPHDAWGYDVNSQPVLFDLPGRGPAVGVAAKSGWFYALDRRNGKLLFKSAPFVPLKNTFAQPTAAGIEYEPGSFGGAQWSPVSFDPNRATFYVTAVHWPALLREQTFAATASRPEFRVKQQLYRDNATGAMVSALKAPQTGPPHTFGTLSAIDTRLGGKIRWQVRTPERLVGGALATAGGLVFTGQADGRLTAFDSDTGKELWSFQTGAGVSAPPVSYEIGGTQYIAVAAGGNTIFGFPPGGAFFVFALPRQ
ncbi:MAG: pyrroloquinoline quinone-dependent dehydrogenase [Burkholderiales bacterium]